MKSIINKSSKKILLLFAAVLLITACKKEKEETLDPARLFKASNISITAGQTSADIKWAVPLFSSGKALTYTVDFSKDAAFTTVDFTKVVDTAGIKVTDENLTIRIPYYIRIKANAFENQPESKYIVSTSTVTITGTQMFTQIRETELRETSVGLRFISDPALSSIKLTPATGAPITVALTASDLTAGGVVAGITYGLKTITGLTGNVKYTAQIFAGTKDKGLLEFTTLPVTTYTLIISPTDNLATTISAATNGAVIGLNPGVYNLPATVFITQKTITLKSTSGSPSDTKVNFKEIDIEGTGAGITLSGIDLDGTNYASLYFLNFIGSQASVGSAATFTNILVDNCIVHGVATSFLRADRGSYKIGSITVNNSIVHTVGLDGASSYFTFHLNKLDFASLNITKSTFSNFGPGLVTANAAVTFTTNPSINISYSTFNSFGGGGTSKYVLFDANAQPVKFTLTNSIIANTPKSTSAPNTAAIRASVAAITLSYNNVFNLYTTNPGTTPLTLPVQSNSLAIDLGWTHATPTFELPTGSPLRTASNTGTAIGDPRWTY
ncbi:DUF4957 domain-containing protein [Pedobacter polaris]|uniref:DUF4957 domain-containing protein n=1 Tax=Pedobacter polaris TaxID=2571273 RepID=A0A4U1CIK1_9SPHI|nr:DUF4957 domain-containing protein [Pedobacter polaris]TKC06728.1 DUF4957 domain-containing protein [Pedobacter polaris]